MLERTYQPCLFDRMDWLESLHRLALPGKPPLLLHAQQDGAEAWMPLMQEGSGHHVALANWYSFLWRPIYGGEYDADTRLSLLRQLACSAKDLTKRLTLAPVPGEDGSAHAIAAAFRSSGWFADLSECNQNHYVRLQGRSFDTYWATRPGQLRSTVKRKSKSAAVSTRIYCTFDENAWEDYQQVYARSWKPSEGSPQFLETLARQEGIAGNLRLGLAYIDGLPVAAQFWTVENDIALIHKLAHDEHYVAASPGTLLSAALFRHVIDIDRVAEIDFGLGNDPYKQAWMEQIRPRYRIDLLLPGHVANWPVIARHHLRQLRGKAA
ncbi:GNAT family N-acetyltransferase [Sphingorhabdus sp.]|uniref:GNAT family N-acetyltransferase n=1 Tax=Sphingorhabdus sp. TaxID=1902408 RepID=UPI00391D9F98